MSKSLETLFSKKPSLLFGLLILTAGYILITGEYLWGGEEIPPTPDVNLFQRPGQPETNAVRLRTDFPSFYYAAKAARLELNMYDARVLDSLAAADGVENHVLPYLYPPLFAVLAQPIAFLNPSEAQHLWTKLAVVGFWLALVLVAITLEARQYKDEFWRGIGSWSMLVLLSWLLPFTTNLAFGQINFLVLLFMVASLYCTIAKDNSMTAGAFLSMAACIKVMPALLLVPMIAKDKMRPLIGFSLGCITLIGISFVIGGRGMWSNFIEFLPSMAYARPVPGGFHPSIPANFSIAGFYMRVFPGEGITIRLLTMFTELGLFAFLLYQTLGRRHGSSTAPLMLPYLVLMTVAAPVAWLHHVVYILPGLAFTAQMIWFGLRGLPRALGLVLLCALVGLAGSDLSPVYRMIQPGESMRPFLISLNLYALLMLFFAGIFIARKFPPQEDSVGTSRAG